MKKVISLALSLLMLAALFVPVSAADTVISPEVTSSITEEDKTGLGLAFLFTMNMQDVQIVGNRTFNGATANGQKIVKLGAIVTNQLETGKNPAAMVLENTNGTKLLDVESTILWDWDTSYLSYAVRIINIPANNTKTWLFARPYFVYESGEIVYGDVTKESRFSYWCAQEENLITLPAIGSDIDVVKQKDRIRVSATGQTVTDAGERQVSLTFSNNTTNWITEETDYVQYTCYDAAGNILDADPSSSEKVGTIYIGCIDTKKNKVKTFEFVVPDDTAVVELTNSKIVYWTEWA